MLVSTYIFTPIYISMGILSKKISIYNYDNHYESLQSIQDANHPKCSIVYTNHPVYTYVH